jgi:hypothetical protein
VSHDIPAYCTWAIKSGAFDSIGLVVDVHAGEAKQVEHQCTRLVALGATIGVKEAPPRGACPAIAEQTLMDVSNMLGERMTMDLTLYAQGYGVLICRFGQPKGSDQEYEEVDLLRELGVQNLERALVLCPRRRMQGSSSALLGADVSAAQLVSDGYGARTAS